VLLANWEVTPRSTFFWLLTRLFTKSPAFYINQKFIIVLSQELSTGPDPELEHSNLQLYILYIHLNIILSPTPQSSKRPFSLQVFLTNIGYAFVICLMHAIYSIYILDLITIIIFWWKVHTMKFLVTYFYLASCYLPPFRSKFSLKHDILKFHQCMSFS
jgi:hypothetical protein